MLSLKRMQVVFLAVVLILSACAPAATNVPPQPTAEPTPRENGMSEETLLISSRPRNTSPSSGDVALRELVGGNTAFAVDLYQRLAEEPGNLFFSPYSISLALAMTFAGARGETEQQMAQTLRFTLPQEQLHPAFNMLDLNLRPPEQKTPTADLWAGQTDEGELGFTYEEVDKLLYLLVDQRYSPMECIEAGFAEDFVRKVVERVRRNHFKRVLPPIAKLSNRTVGYDFLYLRDWGT